MYLPQFCGLQREGVEGEGWATEARPAATPGLRTKAPNQPSPEAPPHPCCGSAYARADWLRRGQSEPGCPARSGPDSVLLCRGRGSPATATSHHAPGKGPGRPRAPRRPEEGRAGVFLGWPQPRCRSPDPRPKGACRRQGEPSPK